MKSLTYRLVDQLRRQLIKSRRTVALSVTKQKKLAVYIPNIEIALKIVDLWSVVEVTASLICGRSPTHRSPHRNFSSRELANILSLMPLVLWTKRHFQKTMLQMKQKRRGNELIQDLLPFSLHLNTGLDRPTLPELKQPSSASDLALAQLEARQLPVPELAAIADSRAVICGFSVRSQWERAELSSINNT